ncbi:TPA: nucleotidyltransferase domain-containing protein, partial [Candidatus Bathyarchaeota archaeon]|nr:nucleotidyltransferase domain-containing protein [Candidatus Bathyarchaeota archaeon]
MEVIEKRRRLREQAINKEALSWAAGLPFKVTAMLVGSHARGDFNLW